MLASRIMHLKIRKNMISINLPTRPSSVHTSPSNQVWPQRYVLFSQHRTIPEPSSVYKKTEIELHWIFVPFHQQPQWAVVTFTSRCSELPSVYKEDNRHQVPTNSCCSTLLPVAGIWGGKFRKGGKEGRKTVPLAQGSDVHLSTLFSQLSPV